jgi:hypothetical protein
MGKFGLGKSIIVYLFPHYTIDFPANTTLQTGGVVIAPHADTPTVFVQKEVSLPPYSTKVCHRTPRANCSSSSFPPVFFPLVSHDK